MLLGWFCSRLLSAGAAQATSEGILLSTLSPPKSRVVIQEDPEATRAFKADPARVRRLVDRGITNLTSKPSVPAAWRNLVSTQDVIGIKVFTSPGPTAGTRVAVVEAVVQGLLAAKVPPQQIIVWDKQLGDLFAAGYQRLAEQYGVRVESGRLAGWDELTFYENPLLGVPVFGDLEFGKQGDQIGRRSYVTKLVTKEVTRLINITPLLNHNSAGVCGSLYSLSLGSVDNALRFEGESLRLAQAVPEIYALPTLGDRVVLNIVDALICQYQGEQVGRLHYSTPLNQIRMSKDPVALDVLSVQELERQRVLKSATYRSSTNLLDLYQNASLLEIGVSDPKRIDVDRGTR